MDFTGPCTSNREISGVSRPPVSDSLAGPSHSLENDLILSCLYDIYVSNVSKICRWHAMLLSKRTSPSICSYATIGPLFETFTNAKDLFWLTGSTFPYVHCVCLLILPGSKLPLHIKLKLSTKELLALYCFS
jgi:hypothetical protein